MPCSLSLANPSFISLICSSVCPCQIVTSPTTLNGCVERYDFVGLPGNFLSVKSGSSSIAPVGSTKKILSLPYPKASSAPHIAASNVAVRKMYFAFILCPKLELKPTSIKSPTLKSAFVP